MRLIIFSAADSVLLSIIPLRAAAPESIDTVQQIATQWTQIRAETVRLQSDWLWQREVLQSTVAAQKDKAQLLEEKYQVLEDKGKAGREELAQLEHNNALATQALSRAQDQLAHLATQLLELRPKLPPRLSTALELPFRTLSDTSLSNAQRAQQVFNILNRSSQFNKTITYGEEPLLVPGNTNPRLLEVIYWGLASGYALDRPAGLAYIGSPGAQGWQWVAAPEITKPLSAVIGMYRDKADPETRELPAKLSQLVTAPSTVSAP